MFQKMIKSRVEDKIFFSKKGEEKIIQLSLFWKDYFFNSLLK
jgi:hypothetical protein